MTGAGSPVAAAHRGRLCHPNVPRGGRESPPPTRSKLRMPLWKSRAGQAAPVGRGYTFDPARVQTETMRSLLLIHLPVHG